MNVGSWKLWDLSEPLLTVQFLDLGYVRAWLLKVQPMDEQNGLQLELANKQTKNQKTQSANSVGTQSVIFFFF